MIFLDEKTRGKIGFDFVMEGLSIASVFGRIEFSKLGIIKEENELFRQYDNIDKCSLIMKNGKCFNELENLFMRFKDIKNTFKRSKNGEVLDEVELFEVKNYVMLLSELKQCCMKNKLELDGIRLQDFHEICDCLNQGKTKTSSFAIYDDYSDKLLKIRTAKREIEKLIYRERDSEKRRELLKKRAEITNEEKDEEFVIRKSLSSEISKYADELLQSTSSVGSLDITVAKARCAIVCGLSRPVLSNKIKLVNGVNPMVKQKVQEKGGRFQPINLEISIGTTVITGANMGGKTVALSIAALNYILANMGFYVFAEEFEFIPLEFMYFLSEDAESLQNGLSTFGGEVIKLKQILKDIKQKRGFIILDEFARGTNPEEGSSITKALVKYLNSFASISLISTHYDGVCSVASNHYQVKGLSKVDFSSISGIEKEEDFLKLINRYMDYSLEKVEKDTPIPRDAMNICRLMGIDKEIISMEEDYEK